MSLMKMARATFLSDKIHGPKVTSKSVCRMTVSDSRFGASTHTQHIRTKLTAGVLQTQRESEREREKERERDREERERERKT